MRLLLLDNYDSFTWNLAQAFGALGAEVEVVRNDAAPARALLARGWDRIVLSPGPGGPSDAGVSLDLVRESSGSVPLLGVCLGHQAIAEAFGGRVEGAKELVHGRTSAIHHDGRGLFRGLPEPFEATRYHSLAVHEPSLPGCLEVSARAADGTIMALRHRRLAIEGVQFHPESILTRSGDRLLENFLRG